MMLKPALKPWPGRSVRVLVHDAFSPPGSEATEALRPQLTEPMEN